MRSVLGPSELTAGSRLVRTAVGIAAVANRRGEARQPDGLMPHPAFGSGALNFLPAHCVSDRRRAFGDWPGAGTRQERISLPPVEQRCLSLALNHSNICHRSGSRTNAAEDGHCVTPV